MKIYNLFKYLVGFDIALLMAHFFWSKQWWFLNLDYERNLPSIYSGVKLFGVAAMAFVVFLLRPKIGRWWWLIFSLFFIELGVDEIASIHENITYFLVKVIDFPDIFRTPTYNWLLIFSPAIVGAIIFVLLFIYKNKEYGSRLGLYLATALLFFVGAIGSEALSAVIKAKSIRFWLIFIEEGLEMVGATIFLYCALNIAGILFKQRYQKLG